VSAGADSLAHPGAAEAGAPARYSVVAIVLHWTIAAIIVVQLMLGWRLGDTEGAQRSALVLTHKSVGVGILLLSLVRLAWRLRRPRPPEAPGLTALERRLSHWAHNGFYVALIALPLTGWAMISARRTGAMPLLGGLSWPRLPLVGLLPGEAQDAAADAFDFSHTALVWVMITLIFLHVAGALKHHFVSRDTVMGRMCPGAKPGVAAEPRLIAVAAAALLLAGLTGWLDVPTPPARPKPATVGAADLYLDIVAPALDRRCGACHNDDLSRGGLSVAQHGEILQGGRTGPAVVLGAPGRSELLRRILLPADDPKSMPRDGRTPLTPAQVDVIRWWISIGAPSSGTVGALKPPGPVTPALAETLGLAARSRLGGKVEVLPAVPPGDPAAIQALNAAGFTVRRAARDSNLLDINLYRRGRIGTASLAALDTLRRQIRTLALADAEVTDDQLAVIGRMENLSALRLSLNGITDAGAVRLAGLQNLRSLNLYGTRITDDSLADLGRLPRLERLHVWRTRVTEAGAARLRARRPGLAVDLDSGMGGAPS
jgi:cytochrome b561